jgi:hypothetical protein
MRKAVIADGVVINVIEVDPDQIPDWAQGFPEAGDAGPGWTWDGESFAPPPEPDPAERLTAERAAMVCSRLQGRLVLGEATCAALDAMAADPTTPWAMRQTIAHAIEWRRTSQAMTELGYLLGYSDAQMDELFRLAMTVQV